MNIVSLLKYLPLVGPLDKPVTNGCLMKQHGVTRSKAARSYYRIPDNQDKWKAACFVSQSEWDEICFCCLICRARFDAEQEFSAAARMLFVRPALDWVTQHVLSILGAYAVGPEESDTVFLCMWVCETLSHS